MVLFRYLGFFAALALFCYGGPADSAEFDYAAVQTGTLKGKLVVQWMEPDVFLFIPDKEQPLTFVRSGGFAVTPGRMLTDGGSVPRPIWILRNYSPWGFAPAFIVHDWLFHMKNCEIAGFDQHSLEDAGLIMAEVMKTMIESKKIDAGALTVHSMYSAVVSPFAKRAWEEGKCNPPPAGMFTGKPLRQFELSF